MFLSNFFYANHNHSFIISVYLSYTHSVDRLLLKFHLYLHDCTPSHRSTYGTVRTSTVPPPAAPCVCKCVLCQHTCVGGHYFHYPVEITSLLSVTGYRCECVCVQHKTRTEFLQFHDRVSPD